jgi:hypothetical protein
MNRTRAIKYEKIIEQLDKEKDIITLISCNTCVRLAKTGGEEKMTQLALKLKEDGYNVKDGFLITLPCWDSCLDNVKIHPTVNTLILPICSCGCANVETRFPECKIVPTVIDRGTIVEDPVTHRKQFRGTKRC